MDVVLRLLFSAAVFIRFGERVCDMLLACVILALTWHSPILKRAVAPLLTPHDLSPHVQQCQHTGMRRRKAVFDVDEQGRMWRRRVGGALESGGRLHTERLEVFDWAGHKRCASWFLLEGLLSYRLLGLSRGFGFKERVGLVEWRVVCC